MKISDKSLFQKMMLVVSIFVGFGIAGCNDGGSSNASAAQNSNNLNSNKQINSQANSPQTNDNVVTVYLLIDNLAKLQTYVDDLSKVDKVNFNRVIFSFVRPTLPNYTSGNLENTGILGYYGNGDGEGVTAFQKLKDAIAISHTKNIQTFLSVGGWNYSCNFDVYGTACGDESQGPYDWFPDPTDPNQAQIAKVSYNNIIQLANDLGVDGVDVDYEEFWHADKYAVKWNGNPWDTTAAKSVLAAGGPTYTNLVKFENGGLVATGPAIMPATIAKVDAIFNNLEQNPNASTLLFATAAPPVGARPIMSYVYSDSTLDSVNTYGGLWWLGNLKGLWYNLVDSDLAMVNKVDSLGLMTYDLCGDNSTTCAPYLGGPVDLSGQVDAYVNDYINWLKSPTPAVESLTVDPTTGKVTFLPAKYNIKPRIQFGFEVNDPAYPKTGTKLQLTKALTTQILQQEANKTQGVIIWQMYSTPNKAVADYATAQDTIAQSCKTFLSNDPNYDCNANFPASAEQ